MPRTERRALNPRGTVGGENAASDVETMSDNNISIASERSKIGVDLAVVMVMVMAECET